MKPIVVTLVLVAFSWTLDSSATPTHLLTRSAAENLMVSLIASGAIVDQSRIGSVSVSVKDLACHKQYTTPFDFKVSCEMDGKKLLSATESISLYELVTGAGVSVDGSWSYLNGFRFLVRSVDCTISFSPQPKHGRELLKFCKIDH